TQRLLELVHELGNDAEQVLIDEVQTPGQLLLDRRLLETQLAGEPQQLDLGPDGVDQRAALPRRPAWRFQIYQAPVDAAVLFEHGHALGFGGVRRDHRPDAQPRHQGADFVGRHAGRRRRRDHVGESPAHLLRAALNLALAPLAHGGVLLGDGEELEPRALRLDGPADEVRGCACRERLAPEHALDVGRMGADDVEQAVVQQVGRALQIVGRAHTTRSRGAAPEKKALRFSSARRPIATRVSCVALPRWGSNTTFSMVRSSGDTWGSRSNTSRAAPAIRRVLSAATSAASSTISPRAVLIRNAVGFMSASRAASIR